MRRQTLTSEDGPLSGRARPSRRNTKADPPDPPRLTFGRLHVSGPQLEASVGRSRVAAHLPGTGRRPGFHGSGLVPHPEPGRRSAPGSSRPNAVRRMTRLCRGGRAPSTSRCPRIADRERGGHSPAGARPQSGGSETTVGAGGDWNDLEVAGIGGDGIDAQVADQRRPAQLIAQQVAREPVGLGMSAPGRGTGSPVGDLDA